MVCFKRASSARAHLMAPAMGGWFLVTGGACFLSSKISVVWSISRANCGGNERYVKKIESNTVSQDQLLLTQARLHTFSCSLPAQTTLDKHSVNVKLTHLLQNVIEFVDDLLLNGTLALDVLEVLQQLACALCTSQLAEAGVNQLTCGGLRVCVLFLRVCCYFIFVWLIAWVCVGNACKSIQTVSLQELRACMLTCHLRASLSYLDVLVVRVECCFGRLPLVGVGDVEQRSGVEGHLDLLDGLVHRLHTHHDTVDALHVTCENAYRQDARVCVL